MELDLTTFMECVDFAVKDDAELQKDFVEIFKTEEKESAE